MAKVLIVDDSPTVVAAFQQLFLGEGDEVLTASDGLSALNIARKERPDLILLDLMLPTLGGLSICKMLKSDERFRSIKIVLFTERMEEGIRQMGRETGADEYLTKEIDPVKVLEIAHRLLKEAP